MRKKKTSKGAICVPAKRTAKIPSTIKGRRKLKGARWVFPERKAYDISDAYHATLALQALLRVAGRQGTAEPYRDDARIVLAKVRKMWPGVWSCEKDLVKRIRTRFRLKR